MFINQKSFSLFIAIVFLLISNLSLLSASAATDDQPSLVELEAITINNPKIELLIYIDDLNQDFNNIQTAFPEIRLVSKFKATKKLYKYSAYEILGQSRTLLSTVSSQKTSNTLTLGNFEDIDQKNIEIEVEDRKGSVNVYKALIRIANTPSSESETSSNDTDASLFATCFTTQNSNDYDKCLELFFRKVTFTLGNSDAVVTNDAGNFVVTLPSAKVASAGPIGPSGPQGPKGDSGGDYWQLLGNNLINNGALSNIRVNNFVFGDSIIAKDGANKIAFEKSNASLRIGSTSAGEWNQRGANSAVIGKNSSATQDGSFSFGDLNKNESMFSFVLGQNNQASGGNLANLPGDETGTTTIKQKSFVVGYENIDDGGASFTLGAKNKNFSRNSLIVGNTNSISTSTEISNEEENDYNPLYKPVNLIFGSKNTLFNEKNIKASENDLYDSRSFIAGSYNRAFHPGHKIYGDDNSIQVPLRSDIYGSDNSTFDYLNITDSKEFSGRNWTKMFITGSDNNIDGPSPASVILGNSNTITCGSKNNDITCGYAHLLIGKSNTSGYRKNNDYYDPNAASPGDEVIAIGSRNTVNSAGGLAMGRLTLVEGDRSIAIGSGSPSAPLTISQRETLGIGILSKKPAILVTAPDEYTQAEIGNVAIGDVLPKRQLHISEAMRIEPQKHAPSKPSLGDIYVNASEAVCVYAAGAWTRIAGTGTCSD